MKNTKNIIMSKTLAGLLSLASLFSAAVIPVYAENSADESVKTIASVSKSDSDILVDARIKEFYNLDKVGKYLNFDYKVPAYIKDGYNVSLIRVMKTINNSSFLQLNFSTNTDQYNYDGCFDATHSLYEFTGDIEETIKNINYGDDSDVLNLQVSKEEKTLGSVKGMYVTFTAYLTNRIEESVDGKTINKESSKYFVFTKDGVNYAVDTKEFNGEDDLNTEINKIASSLKAPCDIETSKYVINSTDSSFYSIDVYDKSDFNKAVEYLGYTPKFLTKINNDITIKNCEVNHSDSNGSSITRFQCNYTYKDKGVVVFIQEKGNDTYGYEDVAQNGYKIQKDYEDNTTKKVPAEKLNWNNVDVYKYFDDCDNKYIYQWKIGDMYYFFETYFNGEKENVDNIAKALFEAE